MKSIKFSLAYITPLIVLFSLYSENYGAFTAVFVLFIMIPLIELFTKGSTANLSKIEEELEKENKVYDWMLYGLVPLQYLIMVYFLMQVSNESLPLSYKIGATTAYGMACGILGINAAHELGHRPIKYEQFMSKLLLLSTLYMHFFIEHNRGHHKNVSTDEDPASSRYGETVYAFYVRTILGSYSSAWHIESERLKKKNLAFWSINNEMLVYQLVQLILIVLIGIIFGLNTLLFFIVGAFIGILLLETVNYIEHYGLKRKMKGDTYERTMPIHSWNSNHPLGRLILLELSRHSDHHYMASRKYQVLRHFDESPQMPTGYPGMLLLSLVPPLWFKVMHQRIDRYKQSQMGVELG
jgi:alkane 1-monooxygenase